MDKCYLCGETFNETDVIKHGEHIIQQAIGGTLIVNDVLCKSCGEALGRTIDAPFNKMFDGICSRLDIRTHRGNKRSKSVKGKLHSCIDKYGNNLDGTEVIWKDGKVAPIQPFYRHNKSSNQIIVYAENGQLRNYIKKVNKILEEEFDVNSRPDLITCDDISGVVIYPLEIVKEHFRKGMAKIAIGFASSAGVDRKFMDMVMDLESREIKMNILLIPYYPLTQLDQIIEENKRKIRYYPSHTLILFTTPSDQKTLVCYIELFSTFQWYVVLSERYDGRPIYKGYTQRLDKVKSYNFEPDRRYYKERSMILASLNITEDEINKTYERQKELYKGKTIQDVEIEIIKRKYSDSRYQLYFDEEVKSAIDFAMNEVIRSRNTDSFQMDALADLMKNVQLFYKSVDDQEVFESSAYRRIFMKDGRYCDSVRTLNDFQKTCISKELNSEYGYKKVIDLSMHIQEKNINEKLITNENE